MAEIAIAVLDPAGNRFAQLVDNYAQVQHVIPMLVNRLGLPTQLTYQLIPLGTQSKLPTDKTLVDAGVRPGAELRLVPIRDNLFASITKKLYDETKDYAAQQLWELAHQRLDQLFRTHPEQPDPAGLLQIVPGIAGGVQHPETATTPPARPAATGGAPTVATATNADAAAATQPAASGGGGFGCLVLVILIGGVVAYNQWAGIEKWWDKNRPEWAKNIGKGKEAKDAKDPYGIFLVGKDAEVICGQRSVLENTPKGHLHAWGLDNTTTVGQSGVEIRMIRGPFVTAEETRRAYEAELIKETVKDMGIANYTKATFRFDGKDHMIDNATRLLR